MAPIKAHTADPDFLAVTTLNLRYTIGCNDGITAGHLNYTKNKLAFLFFFFFSELPRILICIYSFFCSHFFLTANTGQVPEWNVGISAALSQHKIENWKPKERQSCYIRKCEVSTYPWLVQTYVANIYSGNRVGKPLRQKATQRILASCNKRVLLK